jgi:predicted DCC family thiol-disulfide oxidoreductase YuxK
LRKLRQAKHRDWAGRALHPEPGRRPKARSAKPVVIYDGDCDFCRFWLARWRVYLGDRLEYMPLRDPAVGQRFPDLSPDQLKRAVHLVEPDGTVYTGARAVFEALELGWSRFPIRAYRRIPGIAMLSELGYRIVASNRPFLWRLTRLFFRSVRQGD